MTELSYATWLRARGTRVKEASGHFWRIDRGRGQPTHFTAQLPVEAVKAPSPTCWAYRSALEHHDEQSGNGFVRVHIIPDLENYSMNSLGSTKQRQVRAAAANLRFIEIVHPELLLRQGLSVMNSGIARHGYGRRLTQARYRRSILHYFNPRRGIILGALLGEHLAGYATAFAVGSTAYLESVHLETASLNTDAGPGLTFELAQLCRRTPGVMTLVNGLMTTERPGLVDFKRRLGFVEVGLPAKYWLAPGASQILRAARPNAFLRWTGNRAGERPNMPGV